MGISVSGGSVYVSGTYRTDAYGHDVTPCYWKDGIRIDLSVPAGGMFGNGIYGRSSDIAVSGGSVYVSGDYNTSWFPGTTTACYWKDGVRFDLPVPAGNEGQAYGIAVAGGSVYVAGGYFNSTGWNYGIAGNLWSRNMQGAVEPSSTAYYWKDGVKIDLPVPEGTNGGAFGVAVSGGSVYITGGYNTGFKSSDKFVACYWKDGVRFDLPIPTGTEYRRFGYNYRIVVSGGSVYVSGYYSQGGSLTACYWKDGERFDLPVPAGFKSETFGIAVSGSSVYVSGYITAGEIGDDIPCYWKDGVRVDLPVPAGAGFAWDITVVEN